MARTRRQAFLGRTLGVALAAAVTASSVQAQDPLQDSAILHGQSFANSQGAVSVNAAAGVNNQQANVAVIANGRVVLTAASLLQALDSATDNGDRLTSARIEDGAFANSSGLIAVNVAAGADNQQGNLALISTALGGQILTDITLSQTRGSQQPTGLPGSSSSDSGDQTSLGPGTFANSSGIVQVSLIGGERNASSNLFALSVSGNAEP